MIRIVNKNWHKPTPNDIYIGRGSPVGNPFSHLPSKFSDVTIVSSREEAIAKYEQWLLHAYYNDASVHMFIKKLIESQLMMIDVNLTCFCAPHRCHGDVIKKFVDDYLQKIRELT